MKNPFKKTFCAALLSAVLLVSSMSVFSGCSKDSVNLIGDKYTKYENKLGTTHKSEVSTSNIDLVKNGQSNYRIVYPTAFDSRNETAVGEMQTFFLNATDCLLEILKDTDENLPTSSFISIGNTTLARQAGLSVPNDVGDDGYIIRTIGENVFIIGGSEYGNIFGIYEFLAHHFNYHYFAMDEIRMERGVKNKKLMNMDVKQSPDIATRLASFGEGWMNADNARRFRVYQHEQIWMQVDGKAYHNFFALVPKDDYLHDHQNWYSTDTGRLQLCLSRDVHGLSAVVIEKLKQTIDANPMLKNITFTQEDNWIWCECESCNKIKADNNNSDAAVYIKFSNLVAREIKKWLDEERGGREVTISIFAYTRTEDAPVIEKDGKLVPTSTDMILEDNLALFYAPIEAAYYYSFNDTINAKYKETLEKWKVLSDKIYMWTYSTYFACYLYPFDNFNSIQENYQYFYKSGAKYIFDQSQYSQALGTDWYRLKQYIGAQLQWDCQLNLTQLIDTFFENYYKDAAPKMKEYFDDYRIFSTAIKEDYKADKSIVGYCYELSWSLQGAVKSQEAWPMAKLNHWLSLTEEAKSEIAGLRESDPGQFRLLTDRIDMESLAIRYLLVDLYKSELSTAEYNSLLSGVKTDVVRLGLTAYGEGMTIDKMQNTPK